MFLMNALNFFLFSYLSSDQNIEMTSPVLIKVEKWRFFQMGVYTMSFLLPAEHQMTPPKPTDNKVGFSEKNDSWIYSVWLFKSMLTPGHIMKNPQLPGVHPWHAWYEGIRTKLWRIYDDPHRSNACQNSGQPTWQNWSSVQQGLPLCGRI